MSLNILPTAAIERLQACASGNNTAGVIIPMMRMDDSPMSDDDFKLFTLMGYKEMIEVRQMFACFVLFDNGIELDF